MIANVRLGVEVSPTTGTGAGRAAPVPAGHTAVMLEGRVLDVWLAIRDNGAQTAHQIAQRVGCRGHQVGPIIFWLMQHGWVARLGLYHYVNARLARQMGAP